VSSGGPRARKRAERIATGPGLLVCGCTVWDEIYPAPGRLLEGRKLVPDSLPIGCPGGMAARTAWMAAKMGVPTKLVSVVGDDELGRKILMWLEKGGVDCSGVAL
jgi:sugar/nucleoside kinase (ribokinase family)